MSTEWRYRIATRTTANVYFVTISRVSRFHVRVHASVTNPTGRRRGSTFVTPIAFFPTYSGTGSHSDYGRVPSSIICMICSARSVLRRRVFAKMAPGRYRVRDARRRKSRPNANVGREILSRETNSFVRRPFIVAIARRKRRTRGTGRFVVTFATLVPRKVLLIRIHFDNCTVVFRKNVPPHFNRLQTFHGTTVVYTPNRARTISSDDN